VNDEAEVGELVDAVFDLPMQFLVRLQIEGLGDVSGELSNVDRMTIEMSQNLGGERVEDVSIAGRRVINNRFTLPGSPLQLSIGGKCPRHQIMFIGSIDG